MISRKYRGSLNKWLTVLHQTYGEVVRIAPNEVSYINPQAWKDIYGFRTGGKQSLAKDPLFYGPDASGGNAGLFRAGDASHGRQRRVLSHAFSDRALNDQEPMFEHYAQLLVQGLRKSSTVPNNKVDMERWYNYATFDVMADLTFGEPLHLLEDQSHEWFLDNVFSFLKLQSMSQLLRYYPFCAGALRPFFIPKKLVSRQARNNKECIAKVNRRLERASDKQDVWGLVMKQEGEKAMSRPEMHANAITMMVAGTETTATALSGLTFYLLRNPDKMKKLTEEIRSNFDEESEIDIRSLARLEYLNACIQEGLRMYPPVPLGPPRLVPEGGANVCDTVLPAGASTSSSGTSDDTSNFCIDLLLCLQLRGFPFRAQL
jgi:cytochrome P450